MQGDLSPEIKKIQETVVGMYSEHPWPLNRETDEEMGWRLKCLGVTPSDYQGKKVLDMGCGTGEYAMWYAKQGAAEVQGIDLSKGSLAIANQRKAEGGYHNADFREMDILNCSLPDNYFDYSYSVGVLHHTGDPLRGFKHLVRATKPGGVVVVSLYNSFSRRTLRTKQTICRWLGGADIDKRVEWGERLFGGTLRKLDKRYHGLNTKQIAYDIFGFPHESLHSAQEVLRWFDETGLEYKGAFAPLRITDYFYAFQQPEYSRFRSTFDGFPVMRAVADGMVKLAGSLGPKEGSVPPFPRPSLASCVLSQLIWVPFGLRFNCFTIAGTKKG
ncbi:MAG: class I SAM-dependent methyltransferase [Proteobacteria bacterium]|nr:class I SAM-dependent methyltransferase [Pseudomonadota bacterium]MBU1450524.1 class I SAM-dependent methyltransferase [Pseudomonadota bacterium]MBU2470030.1 class I SAM-dependent methyltransferase [Pseudomonadota bacterium]MBU2519209.1 class I SAM-dependent methyltransferase [Pseudomonadota bacterium]